MDYGLILAGSNSLNLITFYWWICVLLTLIFWRHTMLTDGLEWCGLLWCFYQLFGLSFWRHPFTAEDPLLSKWWNATFLKIWWRNKIIYFLNGLRLSTFSLNFHFWVSYSSGTPLKSGELHVTHSSPALTCRSACPVGTGWSPYYMLMLQSPWNTKKKTWLWQQNKNNMYASMQVKVCHALSKHLCWYTCVNDVCCTNLRL